MSEGEPTAGPWHVVGTDEGPGERHLHIASKNSMMVLASINCAHVDAVANANLMASAPTLKAQNADLVEALEQIKTCCEAGATHLAKLGVIEEIVKQNLAKAKAGEG